MNLVPIFELDRGGMGTVSVAARVEGSFVRYFAVKRLLPELRADAAQRAMFIEEARIAGALVHPNVVPVIDVGEDRDGPYLVMEYVDGVSAAACIKALRALRQTLPVGVAVLVARDVMRGVAAAHEATDAEGRALGIVHRDLSPQNVLIDFAGRARVTDFGIARAAGGDHHTRTGVLKGKLGYMAPEQLRFQPADQRSDLFSCGILVYELISGARLYASGTDGKAGARRILEEPPPDLLDVCDDAPPSLVQLTLDLLMKDPADRPASAREVADELDAILRDEFDEREEAAQLSEILERCFGEQRSERSLRLSLELEKASASRSSRWPWVAGALLVAGVAGAAALWTSEPSSPPVVTAEPSEHLPSDSAPSERASAASESAALEPQAVEAQQEAELSAAAEGERPAAEVRAPSETGARPRRRRPRRRLTRMAAPTPMAATSTPMVAAAPSRMAPAPASMMRTWDWEQN